MDSRNDSMDLSDDSVFESAAELFRAMAAPVRLKIISVLCNGEKNVTELLASIATTQPNMSQHLNTLYQAGVLGRRREGVSIYYFIANAAAFRQSADARLYPRALQVLGAIGCTVLVVTLPVVAVAVGAIVVAVGMLYRFVRLRVVRSRPS